MLAGLGKVAQAIPAGQAERHITRGSHLPHLDGLRACLAGYVVLHHAYRTVLEGTLLPTWVVVLTGWLQFGRVAVDGFIVLSGYCLMLPVSGNCGRLRQTPWQFYLRRTRRILPTFYFAVAISALMAWLVMPTPRGTPWDACLPVTGDRLLGNLLMCQDLWPGGAGVNYVFWSVAVEWRIYFAFPLLVYAYRRVSPRLLVTVALGLTTATAMGLAKHQAICTTVSYTGLFVLGMGVAAGFTDSFSASLLAAAALTSAAVAAGILARGGLPTLGHPLIDLAVGVAFAAALAYWTRRPKSAVRRALAARPLELVGTMSYSLYLTHAIAIEACWRVLTAGPLRLSGATAAVALAITVLPTSALLAYGFYWTAERPFLSTRQRTAAHEISPNLA